MRVRTLELPVVRPGADVTFALIIDRVEASVLAAPEEFAAQMAIFRDQCGASAVLVSENDIELDTDPAVITDLAPQVHPVLSRMRELRERLTARPV